MENTGTVRLVPHAYYPKFTKNIIFHEIKREKIQKSRKDSQK